MKNLKKHIIFFISLFLLVLLSCDESDATKTRIIVICTGANIDSISYEINNGSQQTLSAPIVLANGIAVWDKKFKNANDIWVQATSASTENVVTMHILMYEDSKYIDAEVVTRKATTPASTLSATFQYPP